MEKNKGRSITNEINAFLIAFSEQYSSNHPGFLSFENGQHLHHRLVDGQVKVNVVTGSELDLHKHFLIYWEDNYDYKLLTNLEIKINQKNPDIASVEAALRNNALDSASRKLKRLLEIKDEQLPTPDCPKCQNLMRRESGKRKKTFTSIVGKLVVLRNYYYCRGCQLGIMPLDKRIGLVKKSIMPEMERMIMAITSEVSSYRGKTILHKLTGVEISRSRIDRETRRRNRTASQAKNKLKKILFN